MLHIVSIKLYFNINLTAMVDRIRDLYEKEGMTTSAFARKVGVAASTINMAEHRYEKEGHGAYSQQTLSELPTHAKGDGLGFGSQHSN